MEVHTVQSGNTAYKNGWHCQPKCLSFPSEHTQWSHPQSNLMHTHIWYDQQLLPPLYITVFLACCHEYSLPDALVLNQLLLLPTVLMPPASL
jgi:hypothetical protein